MKKMGVRILGQNFWLGCLGVFNEDGVGFFKKFRFETCNVFRKTYSIFFDFLGNSYILPEQLFSQTPLVECF